jgi:hypothetical protein
MPVIKIERIVSCSSEDPVSVYSLSDKLKN